MYDTVDSKRDYLKIPVSLMFRLQQPVLKEKYKKHCITHGKYQ